MKTRMTGIGREQVRREASCGVQQSASVPYDLAGWTTLEKAVTFSSTASVVSMPFLPKETLS